uniref:Helicase C-terminal domain-containing protein n=1 Tax=Parastrongyloides trichosuri TaxID=131310 RepID=A0A0N4ZPN4_PARTI
MIDTTMIRLDKENVQLLGVKQYVQFEIINPKMRVFTSNALLAANILKRQQFNQAIIFVNETKFLIDFACQLTKYLKEYPVQIMSGSMLQADRNNVMNDLKNKKIKVLISTDLLSRGVDSQHIDLVININIPKDVCTYLHRIGRAGRFGNYGASFTLIDNVKSLVTFNEMVYINKLNVKYLTKSMLKSSHLTVDKNIFKGGKDYNDDLSRELCYELCDAFKSVRYIEKENFKVIRYTKEDIIKIRNSKPKSDWKDIAKVVFKDSGKTFHDIDRDIFHKTQKFESNKRNDTIDKFKKLDVNDGKRNNKNSPKKENLKDKNQGNKSTKDKKNKKNDKDKNFQEKNHEESSEEYSQEETKFYEHVTEGIKVKEIELEEAESDNSVYRYSVEEMLKIRDSKTLEQWRSIFLKMNLGLKTYTDGPVVFDYELRIPFELQLRISRTRQNKAMKSAQNDILNAAKYASSFEKGKIVKNFCSDIILPSLPCKPKNLYEELYNLATGNDKYNIPINEEYLVSSSYWDKYPDMKHFKYEKTTWQEDCSNEA